MTKDELLKRELIKKHLEGWSGLEKSSIEHYVETGKVSGTFFTALKAMLDEYVLLRETEECSHNHVEPGWNAHQPPVCEDCVEEL